MTNRLVWYVVVPLVAAIFLFFAVLDAGPTWRALQHDGVDGWFTGQSEACNRASCHWDGSFLSHDRTLTRTCVRLDGAPAGLRRGAGVRPFARGDRRRGFRGGRVVQGGFSVLFAAES